jgi:hypothetical protein
MLKWPALALRIPVSLARESSDAQVWGSRRGTGRSAAELGCQKVVWDGDQSRIEGDGGLRTEVRLRHWTGLEMPGPVARRERPGGLLNPGSCVCPVHRVGNGLFCRGWASEFLPPGSSVIGDDRILAPDGVMGDHDSYSDSFAARRRTGGKKQNSYCDWQPSGPQAGPSVKTAAGVARSVQA